MASGEEGFDRRLQFERRLLDAMPAAILVCRADGVVTFATPQATRLLASEALAQELTSLVSEESHDPCAVYLAQIVDAPRGTIARCELAVDGDEHTKIVDVTAVNRLEDPEIGGVVLSLVDVTHHVIGVADRFAIEELTREPRADGVREARTDPLTGLANRRAFDENLPALHSEALCARRTYAVVVVDLDLDAGDATLRSAARVLRESMRVEDVVYRIGGGVLVAILVNTGTDEALEVAHRIRAALGCARPHPGSAPITASIGVADFDPARHHQPGSVLAAADRAMRRAKRSGGDRVTVEDRRSRS